MAQLIACCKNQKKLLRLAVLLAVALGVSGCVSKPPIYTDDICKIFLEKPRWHKSAVRAAERWQSNVGVPMAIMAQESGYRARAKPPMQYFLGFIPTGRASNAYGYAQALDSTWAEYKEQVGTVLSRREVFDDAMDFIQWYMNKTTLQNQIAKTDGYNQYLNYHEGQGGFASGSFKSKGWLINVAKKVDERGKRYNAQYAQCSAQLKKKSSWSLF